MEDTKKEPVDKKFPAKFGCVTLLKHFQRDLSVLRNFWIPLEQGLAYGCNNLVNRARLISSGVRMIITAISPWLRKGISSRKSFVVYRIEQFIPANFGMRLRKLRCGEGNQTALVSQLPFQPSSGTYVSKSMR